MRSSQRRTAAAVRADAANAAAGDANRDRIQPRPVNLAALRRDHVDAVIRSNLALLDGAAAWNNEIPDFANAQVRTHWSRAYGFAPGPHPADVMAAQCFGHAARLMHIAARTVRDHFTQRSSDPRRTT